MHKSEGVRGRLYDHQPTPATADTPTASNVFIARVSQNSGFPLDSSVISGNPALSKLLFSGGFSSQPQHPPQQQIYPPPNVQPQQQQTQQHISADQQQNMYQQLYHQLQSILLPVSQQPTQPPSSASQPLHPPHHQYSSHLSAAAPSVPSQHSATTHALRHLKSEIAPAASNNNAIDGDSVVVVTPTSRDSDVDGPSDQAAFDDAGTTFADESGVKMSKRNILMADLEEESSAVDEEELDDAASDVETGAGTTTGENHRKRDGSHLSTGVSAGGEDDLQLVDAKVPKINETYATDPSIEQKIKKMEEDIGFDIANEYHNKTKHLLTHLRQPRQPSTPLTPSNFDGRMQQIVAKHHASQIIVHPPVGAVSAGLMKHNPLFQQPKVIYQNRVVTLPAQGRALAPKPAPTTTATTPNLIRSAYPGPTTTGGAGGGGGGDSPLLISSAANVRPATEGMATPGYTTIILRETKPGMVNAPTPVMTPVTPVLAPAPSNKPRIIVAPAAAVGRSVAAKKNEMASGAGETVVQGTPVMQGTQIVQGTQILQGTPILQGTSMVRTTGIIPAPTTVGLITGGVNVQPFAKNVVTNSGAVGAIGMTGVNYNHISASLLAPATVNVLTTGSALSPRVNTLVAGDSPSTSIAAVPSSSSTNLLSNLADGIVKSGVLQSTKLSELGPQLEASIKAAVGLPSVTSATTSCSNSLSNAPTTVTASSLSSAAAESTQPPVSKESGGGNQAELMMKLYQTLAEVVFGSAPSSELAGSADHSSSATAERLSPSTKVENVTLNGDEPSSSEVPPPPKNFTAISCAPVVENESPSTLAQSVMANASTDHSMADSDDALMLIERTNDVGSPASTESVEGGGGGASAMQMVQVMSGSALGEGDNVCHICQYRFRRVSHLRQHIQEVHEKERRFSCDLCNRLFKRAEHLRKHLRTVHKGAHLSVDPAKNDKSDCIVLT